MEGHMHDLGPGKLKIKYACVELYSKYSAMTRRAEQDEVDAHV